MLTRATNRAVSPVIGVVLMVAITVLLAAVVGVFAIGNNPTTEPAPQAQLTVEEQPGSDQIKVTHDGGDAIDTDQLTAVGTNISIISKNTGSDNSLQAGESLVISNTSSSTALKQGDVIRIRWDDPESSRSTTFLKHKLSNSGWP